MRTTTTISLPPDLLKVVRREVKAGHYASVSEFMRHLVRLYSMEKLAQQFGKMRKEFEAGKGIEIKSFKDLM